MKKMKHQFLIGMVLKLAKIPKDTPGEFREACQFLIGMVLKPAMNENLLKRLRSVNSS